MIKFEILLFKIIYLNENLHISDFLFQTSSPYARKAACNQNYVQNESRKNEKIDVKNEIKSKTKLFSIFFYYTYQEC